jgi:hypothetical protein
MNMAVTAPRQQKTEIWMKTAINVPRPQLKTVNGMNRAVTVLRPQHKTVIWKNMH